MISLVARGQSKERSGTSPDTDGTEPSTTKEPTFIEDLPSNVAADLGGTEWALVSLYGSPPLGGTNATLSIDSDGIRGFSGCNSYGGKATMNEGAFEVREVASTAKGCAEPVLRQEETYRRALSNSASYRTRDDYLEMQDATGETTLFYATKGQGWIGSKAS